MIGIFGIAQKKSMVKNYQIVDQKPLHFGFCVGLNTMDFNIRRNALGASNDTLFADVSKPEPGFHVSIITEYRINEYLAIRFLPGLNFGQRNLNYISDKGESVWETKIESNYLDFPLLLKYSSKRINNYRPYLITGLSMRYDMAAKKEFEADQKESVLLKPYDFCWEGGFGIDFYLKYFKLSTEIKLALGTRDVLLNKAFPGSPQYLNAIDRLTSKHILLSFHFE